MIKMIPPLKAGTRVAVQNTATYGFIAKRVGANRYWVTLPDAPVPASFLMNRNTFRPA